MTIDLPALRDRPLPRGRTLWPILALLATIGVPAHAVPADGIHWTVMGQNAITMDWRGGSDTLFYGLTTSYGSMKIASPPNVTPFSSAGPFREAQVTALAENTLYHYKIGFDGTDATFRTPPPRGTSGFRFAAQGDVGSSLNYPVRVAPIQAMIGAQSPRFVLMLGDLSYANSFNDLEAVETHYNDMMVWSRDAAYMPAWGNHEYESPLIDDLANYKGRFELPNQQASPGAPASGCCGEDWSWFDYGNVRFIGIPEPYSGAWTDWATKVAPIMDAAQADPAIRFIVTFGHRPSFSSGAHAGESSIRTKIAALAATRSKYVLNLNGHSHDYERTHAQSGVVHVTAGTGGSHLSPASGSCKWHGGCPPPAWVASRAMHHVVVTFDVTDDQIIGSVHCGPPDATRNDITCTQGSLIETFVVPAADQAPIVTAPVSVPVDPGTEVSVTVTAAEPNGQAIQSLTAENLPSGAVFTPGAGNLTGTLTWTPSAGQSGAHVVTFRASNALEGTAQTTIDVSGAPQGPNALVAPSPGTGNQYLFVAFDASGSIDPDGEVTQYFFDFGDGTTMGPQSSPYASHTFGAGHWDVEVTAWDDAGNTGVATTQVIVASMPPGPNLATNASFETSTSGWGPYNGSTIVSAAGGFDQLMSCHATAGAPGGGFGVNDSPNWVSNAGPAGSTYRFSAWARSTTGATGAVRLRVSEYQGSTKIGSTMSSPAVTLSPTWQLLTLDFVTVSSGSSLDFQIADTPVVPGESFCVDNVSIHDISGILVGVGDPGSISEARAWVTPMPITGDGSLRFTTPRPGPAVVEIFDLSGRRIGTPLDASRLDAGLHEVSLGTQKLRPGLYLYRIRLDRTSLTGRFVIAG